MLNGSVILSVLELWHKTLKFLFLVFNDFVRKKKCESKKGFLSFMLQLRGLLWMVTCSEKRPKFQVFILAIRPKQNKNIHSNNSRNLVFTRLQSIDGWKRNASFSRVFFSYKIGKNRKRKF